MTTPKQGLIALLAIVAAVSSVGAVRAELPDLQPIKIGKPTKIEVYPTKVELKGSRAKRQLVVTGYYADGSLQDLTRAANYAPGGDQVSVEDAVVTPNKNGVTEIIIGVGNQKIRVPVVVSDMEKPQRVSFEYGALVALSKNGCNAGACHGSPSGKGGFRLSLRAFDPELDKETLIREEYGRRINSQDPAESLLLLKPLMKVPHGGGKQMNATDPAYEVLQTWIAQGGKLDPAEQPRCVKIDVYPKSGRTLKRPAHTQQLAIHAHFSDGSVKDVTDLVVYSSSDEEVASVSENGLVVGHDRGEVAVVIRYLEFIESTFITFVKDVKGFAWKQPPVNNYIDELVAKKLQKLKYLPSKTCTDSEFIRRVYLDITGLLPSVEATTKFLADKSADKRQKLIDSLLMRPEHAKFWALKWGDLLRMTSGQVGADGVYKYHRWLEEAIRNNVPYDKFARQLLTASGSTLTNPAANFYRTAGDTNDCVETISQVFLGARLQCAKCHNHPFERWTQDNYYGMAAFFNRIQRQKTGRSDELFIYMAAAGEVTQPRTGKQMKPWLPVRGDVDKPNPNDRRMTFAEWLTSENNPFFAKIEVNRIWSHLFGRGIVDPVDDFRDTNPPSNAELLDALAKDFVEHGYDRRHIIRVILNSRTYQSSFEPNEFNKDDTKYFSHFQPRLLSAEQLLDAICDVAGRPEQLGSLPVGTKATQLPAPDIVKHEFLKVFGQPERQTVCACERTSESNLGMAIQFFNGPLVYNKLRDEKNRFRLLLAAKKGHKEIIEQLYLAAVCRKPSEKEMAASLAHIKARKKEVESLEDICWALLNTNEFLFQH